MNVGECMEYAQKLCDATTAAARNEARAELRAAIAATVAAERERQPALPPCALTWAIQRLNSTPYAMTKDECVEMLRGLRSEIQALSGPNGLLKGARDEA